MRGFGLPGCALGVTVPTSMKPKPMPPSPSMQRAFLSRPAARPTRLGKFRPASVTGSSTKALQYAHLRGVPCTMASDCSVSSCAISGSRPKRKGRASEYGSSDMDNHDMTQDELKALVGQAALQYVVPGEVVGVGTGSTVNKFIDALASMKDRIPGAVSSSNASTERLRAVGIRVFDANEVGELAVYIDGADEIDGRGYMVKGGGAALTREKIIAAQSKRFVCIADESKLVETLGRFPLPVEVIPIATQRIVRQFQALGGTARVRQQDGRPLVTDNGQHIVDVTGLQIREPLAF